MYFNRNLTYPNKKLSSCPRQERHQETWHTMLRYAPPKDTRKHGIPSSDMLLLKTLGPDRSLRVIKTPEQVCRHGKPTCAKPEISP